MKLTKRKMKVMALSMAIAVIMAVPKVTNAQSLKSDGFFSSWNDGYENRDEGITLSGGISNNSFESPLGSGLLIMVAAGIGYVVKKCVKSKNQGL